LFSQKSNWDGKDLPDFSAPITPTGKDNRDNFTELLAGSISNIGFPVEEVPTLDKLTNLITYTNQV